MSKTGLGVLDTVAARASLEAVRAEHPLMELAIKSPALSLVPVLEECGLEMAKVEECRKRLLRLKAEQVGPGLKTEDELSAKARAKAESEALAVLEEAEAQYERASDRLIARRKDAAACHAKSVGELGALLERLRKEFPLPVLEVIVVGTAAISPARAVGVVTPGELYWAVQHHHRNRPSVGVVAAAGLYDAAVGPLQSMTGGAIQTWLGVVAGVRKVWGMLEGRISLTPPQVAEIIARSTKRGGIRTVGLTHALEREFPWDLSEDQLAADIRTFADLFKALQSDAVMRALQDIHAAEIPREPRQVAKKVVMPPSAQRLCHDFARGECAYGDTCRFRHVKADSKSGM